MTVREYVGARYVPLYIGDWDNTVTYEPLSIVTYQGNSYTSRQYVPTGIDINNTQYWICSGNYNAQVEAYRQEVQTFDNRIDTLETTVGDENSGLVKDVDDLQTTVGDENSGLVKDVDDLLSMVDQNDHMIWIGDSWSTRNTGLLPKTCAKQLNMQLHDYSVSSMGFIQGNENFYVQAQSAIADDTFNHDAVKYIVIYGGSNDFSHGYDTYSQFTTPITNICNALANEFKNAVIHIFFNIRFGYNGTHYKKINDQIKLYNYISQAVDYNQIPAIAHAESSCWIGPAFMDNDDVHPIESGYGYLAGYVAKCLSGGEPDYVYTNMVEYAMTPTHPEYFEGYFYQRYDNRTMEFDVYCNVKQELDDTYAMKTDASGIFPVQLFVNPSVAQKSNQLAFGLFSADGQGDAHCSVQFNKEATGTDTIWLVRSLTGDIKVGHYFGHGKFRLFWS